MKILHVIPSYKPAFIYGGPIISSSQLCEQQVKLGHSVIVYTTTANGREELDVDSRKEYNIDGVSVRYFSRQSKGHSNVSISLVLNFFKSAKKYDVIHIHSWWNMITYFTVLICWLYGIKPILSSRGMLSNYSLSTGRSKGKRIMNALGGRFLLKHTVLHATSIQEVEESKRIISDWEYFVAPNIVLLPKHIERKRSKGEGLKMVFLSRIDPKKGIEKLFSALALFNANWQLSIFGTGNDDYINKLKKHSEELKIQDNVTWEGWVEGDNKYKALANSDLFVLTSKNENFANAALESCAVGTPVLLSDKVGFSEWVEKYKLGWVVPLNVESIANKLKGIEESEDVLHESIGEVTREHFDPLSIAKDYIENYRKLQR